MPCRCDYMEPHLREIESKLVAKHLVYLNSQLGYTTDIIIVSASKDYYGNACIVDQMTAMLCGLIEKLTAGQLNQFVYNGRSKDARSLADWWDDHKEKDVVRND